MSESAHPSAVVADGATACQARVKVSDAIRAADRCILVYLTATVHVAAACQVPVSQRQSRPTERMRKKKKKVSRDERQFHTELTAPPADSALYLEQIRRLNSDRGGWQK